MAASTYTDRTVEALQLLAAGVPLSLLIDLASTVDSTEMYEREAGSADWLYRAVA